MIVKDGLLEKAKDIFGDLGLQFVEVSHFLGGFIGKKETVRDLINDKVKKWVEAVEDLADVAINYPQDA